MKSILATLALTTALTAPGLALARPITFSATLKRNAPYGTFLAIYLTDSNGRYVGSLWMAGTLTQYYRHLSGWYRATRGNTADINGLTGASLGPGRTLQITLDLQDSLIDAGYVIHVDAAAENNYESPNDVTVPLTTAGAGTATAGRMYVSDFHYTM